MKLLNDLIGGNKMRHLTTLKPGYASAVVGRTRTYKVFVFRLFRDVSVNSEIKQKM